MKVLEFYSPALFVRRVGCEVMLASRWPLADSSDVLSDINGQIAYMMRIPRILLMYSAGFGKSWEFAAKQKANSQERHRDSHCPHPLKDELPKSYQIA